MTCATFECVNGNVLANLAWNALLTWNGFVENRSDVEGRI